MQKILVVDDEVELSKLYQHELEAEGYNVLVANNGKDALRLTEEEKVDLMVLDIRMSGTNGLDVLNEFRLKHSDTPVILNSAYSVYKDDFSTWLADAYVVKSGDLSELKTRIRELLRL